MATKPETDTKPKFRACLREELKPKYPCGQPKLNKDETATEVPVLDAEAYARWPHLFCRLAIKYDVPNDFLLTLLFLWDGTHGAKSPSGHVALSQIKVRERDARKWAAALVAVEFFEVAKAGLGDTKGSFFTYIEETPEWAWEAFFDWVGTVKHFRNWDDVSPERFAASARRALFDMPAPET